jgi:hypothetical protein
VAAPERLECTYTWGGETKTVRVDATTEPYRVPTIAVGDHFLLKIVYVKGPADVAGVRVYTYEAMPDGLLPLTESKFRAPYGAGPYGFTGLALVYEPRGDELAYFCAWVKA